MLTYKGYTGKLDFDSSIDMFVGEVINTADVITFQGSTVAELKQSFMDSINDYIYFCHERGEEPEKPFSGKLNLRLDPGLHREAYIAARESGLSLNSWINLAINKNINN